MVFFSARMRPVMIWLYLWAWTRRLMAATRACAKTCLSIHLMSSLPDEVALIERFFCVDLTVSVL